MKDIREIETKIQTLQKYINEKRGELNNKIKNREQKEKDFNKLLSETTEFLTIKKLLETASKEARLNGEQVLSSIVTEFVQTVFGDKTRVEFKDTLRDGIPSVNVIVYKTIESGEVEINPNSNDGGGLADIISLAIMIAFQQLTSNNEAPSILDEPTKYVSKGDIAEKSAIFLRNIVSFTGKQTIISTHDEALKIDCDTKYHLVIDEDTGITASSKEI